ncbi:sirohydrochlorin chelatase [Carnobacterium gallinarum]|uniref:sirohydrochlorin chelatase n=1 Tax=Carnobacterium gallinarum TaxID=2749 RepID=UPI00054E5AD5|nr:CbiX/SirB N-terminal domain-containing protein [Carnobacterium gallinarum]
MEGIVYVAHGSQKMGKNQKMQAFYQELIQTHPETEQGLAYLEKHPDTIAVIVAKMYQKGIREFIIVPLLLFSAMHMEEDIPQALKEVELCYSDVTFSVSQPFAQEPEVVTILEERCREKLKDFPTNPAILLVAHGSTNYEKPGKIVEKIAKELAINLELPVTAGVLYGKPDYLLEAKQLIQQHPQILVIPFFLFDGHLLDKIQLALTEIKPNTVIFSYTETLNLDRRLINGINHLMNEARVDG